MAFCSGYDFQAAYASLLNGYRQVTQTPLDQGAFWRDVSSLTETAIGYARDALNKEVPELFCASGIAVAYTGSDSRLEKCGLGSPVECIVITPQKTVTTAQKEILDKISRIMSQGRLLFYPDLEQKRLDVDPVSTYGSYDLPGPPTIIPTRAFDAAFLAGDMVTFENYKQKLFAELCKEPSLVKDFKKAFLDRPLQSLRQELNGSPLRAPYISLDSGTVFYERRGRRGLKHDILRSVQYSLANKIFKLIAEGKIESDVVATIPQTVLERLTWLGEKKFIHLSSEETSQLQRNYTQASYWYLLLNDQVVASQNPDQLVTMKLNSRDLRSVIQSTHDICKNIGGE